MLEHLFPPNSLIFINRQGSFYEIFGSIANWFVVRKFKRLCFHISSVTNQISTRPGLCSEEHHVKHNTDAPNVRLGRVWNTIENLRRHEEWSTQVILDLSLPGNISLACKSKVCHFMLPILVERVSWFDIPVDVVV